MSLESSLLALHPLVAAEWHPTKNRPLTPADVVPGTARRVVWRCLADPSHVWTAPVRGRLKSRGCPICSGKVVGTKTSLAARYPALAARWHSTKNGKLTPEQVLPKSNKKPWWRCPTEPRHIFLAAVNAVLVAHGNGTTGCPWCAGKKVDPWRSLASLAPRVAKEWHPSENGSLTPRDVASSSGRRVAWLCRSCAHVWRASVEHRTRRSHGCPACAGRVATPATSLAGRFPALAAEWHPTKNGELTPSDVTPGSSKRAWWRCSKKSSHAWSTTVAKRALRGYGCPICSNHLVTRATSLASTHRKLMREWDAARNAELDPFVIAPGSHERAWWRCEKDPRHVWQAVVYSRARAGHGCPMCSGTRVCETNSLRALHRDIAREWHPTKNGELTADGVSWRSPKRAWWRCKRDPSHEWEMGIRPRVAGAGCPMCSGKLATPATSLGALEPRLAKEWHAAKDGSITPADVTVRSSRKVFWRCSKNHVWLASVRNRAVVGSGCPYCAGNLCTRETSLAALFPRIAREWDGRANGDLRPGDVFSASHRKVWWRCPKDRRHTWQTSIASRTRKKTGCPHCGTRIPGPFNNLVVVHPSIASEWHPTRNKLLLPSDVVPGSNAYAWWRCSLNPWHVWRAQVKMRTKGRRCPFCMGGYSRKRGRRQ